MDPAAANPALLSLWLQAAAIGLSIAAPVGPIGLLTVQRSLNQGAAAGLATGLGAAAADAAYGAVGAFGVSALIAVLTGARVPLAIGGGLFLLWLAWRSWHAPLAPQAASAPGGADLLRCFGGTFVLTLSNPATILSFIAVFGAMAGRLQTQAPWTMVGGVFAGSALWWLLLSQVVAHGRRHFDAGWRQRINRASALLLAGFALWQWWALWRA